MENEQPLILLVDDVPANIQTLNQILKDEYQTLFATNGANALELAASRIPDLILLDVMMPGMDGYEVCKRLKADPLTTDIPIIFVTAMSTMENEETGLELGAIDYITKPVLPPIVKVRVRNHLELKRRGDLLKELSLRDGLTGIANRRRFDEQLDIEWQRCLRNNLPLSLVMIDIDHFKKFNDHYGHLEGDECLKQITTTLAKTVHRPADLVARYGGEEFVCVMPETDLEGAQLLAEKFRAAVYDLQLPHESSTLGVVTISLGLATSYPSLTGKKSKLIENADIALYEAKESGRNCVSISKIE